MRDIETKVKDLVEKFITQGEPIENIYKLEYHAGIVRYMSEEGNELEVLNNDVVSDKEAVKLIKKIHKLIKIRSRGDNLLNFGLETELRKISIRDGKDTGGLVLEITKLN